MELVRRKLQVLIGVRSGACAIAVLLGAIAGSARAQVPCSYQISHVLDLPDCPFGLNNGINAYGISPNGRYVAGSQSNCTEHNKPCVYDAETGQIIPIPLPVGFIEGHAADVNDAGLAAGSVGGPAGGLGFIFDIIMGEFVVQIPSPIELGACEITAINQNGAVCGHRSIKGEPDYLRSAFIWTPENGGLVTDLGLIDGDSTTAADLNDDGWVTGTFIEQGVGWVPFLWRGGEFLSLGTLAPGYMAVPKAVNNHLEVAGQAWVPMPGHPLGASRAFHWRSGIMSNLGLLSGDATSGASDISDGGLVVGYSDPGPDYTKAVVWSQGNLHVLGEMFDHREIPVIRTCIGVSDEGSILVGALDLDLDIVDAVLAAAQQPGDTDADCSVNMDDLLSVVNEWGQQRSPADLNNSGSVGIDDLVIVIENWTPM